MISKITYCPLWYFLELFLYKHGWTRIHILSNVPLQHQYTNEYNHLVCVIVHIYKYLIWANRIFCTNEQVMLFWWHIFIFGIEKSCLHDTTVLSLCYCWTLRLYELLIWITSCSVVTLSTIGTELCGMLQCLEYALHSHLSNVLVNKC